MAWAWHGKYESDTAVLCKSNRKDTFYTLSGTAGARHAMCESAFSVQTAKTTILDYVSVVMDGD
jgi:hypothetical protein